MDIDKPVIVCRECDEPVEHAWQLYCDVCYMRLITESVVRDEVSRKDDVPVFDDIELFDASGQRYEFNGQAWVKRSRRSRR